MECDEHVSSHTQTKPLKCQHCDTTFTSPLGVERHIESEHENYMLKNRSDVEAVNQVNDEVAKNRNNVVAEETNIKCTECEYRCEENIQQESHIKAMHSVEQSITEHIASLKPIILLNHGHIPSPNTQTQTLRSILIEVCVICIKLYGN